VRGGGQHVAGAEIAQPGLALIVNFMVQVLAHGLQPVIQLTSCR